MIELPKTATNVRVTRIRLRLAQSWEHFCLKRVEFWMRRLTSAERETILLTPLPNRYDRPLVRR